MEKTRLDAILQSEVTMALLYAAYTAACLPGPNHTGALEYRRWRWRLEPEEQLYLHELPWIHQIVWIERAL